MRVISAINSVFACGLSSTFIMAASAGGAECGPPLFPARQTSSAGDNPAFTSAGDLDGDDDLDVVVANAGGNSVTVLLNDGEGDFTISQELNAEFLPANPALGDLDHDEDLDLVVASTDLLVGSQQLRVWRNNGQGVFALLGSYSPGNHPRGVAIGDITGDGHQDVVVRIDSGLRVMVNTGIGTLAVGPLHNLTGTGYAIPAVADLDGDRDLDVSASGDNLYYVLRNQGGVLMPLAPLAMPGTINHLSAFHADADDDVDFYAATLDLFGDRREQNRAVILLNSGAGSFVSQAHPLEGKPFGAAVGDFDADEDSDIALGLPDGRMAILANLGGGAFELGESSAAVSQTGGMAAGAFDDDADLDLVIADGNARAVALIQNAGDGQFVVMSSYPAAAGTTNMDLVIGHLNRDNNVDAAVATTDPGGYSVYLGRDDGSFEAPTWYPLASDQTFIAATDMDNDGDLDLLVSNVAQVTVAGNDGDGGFATVSALPFSEFPGFAGKLSPAKLDSDADVDAVVPIGGVAALLFNNGSGTFTSTGAVVLQSLVRYVVATDVNGDESPDLVASIDSAGADSIAVRLNDGAGGFGGGADYPGMFQPDQLVVDDISGEGLPDIVVRALGAGVYSLINIGDGDFGSPSLLPGTFASAKYVTLTDMDDDGDLDLVTVKDETVNGVAISINNGAGAFTLADHYSVMHLPKSPAASSDLDGDGDHDLMVSAAAGLAVLPNLACTPAQLPADLDGDGDVDGFDLALLLGQWGPCPVRSECSADLDGNNVVNGFDLAILLATWT